MEKKVTNLHETGQDNQIAESENNKSDEEQTPRWVKVFGIIAIVLVLSVIILHLVGGGFGGHGVHQS